MPPTRIVKTFDELEDRVARLGLRFEPAASQQLVFQRGKETLGHRIVVGIAYTAHRRPHTRFAAAIAELDGRVLRALIRVMNDTPRTTHGQRHTSHRARPWCATSSAGRCRRRCTPRS